MRSLLDGRVVGVADGGTITLLDNNRQQHRIRLAGIDEPEEAQPFCAKIADAAARFACRAHT